MSHWNTKLHGQTDVTFLVSNQILRLKLLFVVVVVAVVVVNLPLQRKTCHSFYFTFSYFKVYPFLFCMPFIKQSLHRTRQATWLPGG